MAETSVHVDAIINAVVILRQYLDGQRSIVLADQFLYYAEGFPKLRVAPDVMVIFDVEPGPRDNYKTWEEGSKPGIIFEMTSQGTQNQDQTLKKELYENLEIPEYWLFDPKGEWISEKLRGYRLTDGVYAPITDNYSQVLNLRLAVDGDLIAFYQATGERLLAPDDLLAALGAEVIARQQAEVLAEQAHRRAEQERQRAEQERLRAEQAENEVERLKARLRALGDQPDAEA